MNSIKGALFAGLLMLCVSCGGQTADSDLAAAREQYSKGFYLQSEAGYERYLQNNPRGEFRKEAWDRLLNIAANVKGDLKKAIALLDAMSLEEPENPLEAWSILYRLGELHMQMGNISRAVESLEKSLMLASNMPEQIVKTQLKLAGIYRLQNNYDLMFEALGNCRTSATTSEEKATCLYELAQSYSLINNWNMVRKSLEELLTLEGVSEEKRAMATFLLAEAFEFSQDYEKARSLLQSIINTYPNPKVIESRLQALDKPRKQ